MFQQVPGRVPARFQQGSSKVSAIFQRGSSKALARFQQHSSNIPAECSSKVPAIFQRGSSKVPATFQRHSSKVPAARFQQRPSRVPTGFQRGSGSVPVFRIMHFAGTTPSPRDWNPTESLLGTNQTYTHLQDWIHVTQRCLISMAFLSLPLCQALGSSWLALLGFLWFLYILQGCLARQEFLATAQHQMVPLLPGAAHLAPMTKRKSQRPERNSAWPRDINCWHQLSINYRFTNSSTKIKKLIRHQVRRPS